MECCMPASQVPCHDGVNLTLGGCFASFEPDPCWLPAWRAWSRLAALVTVQPRKFVKHTWQGTISEYSSENCHTRSDNVNRGPRAFGFKRASTHWARDARTVRKISPQSNKQVSSVDGISGLQGHPLVRAMTGEDRETPGADHIYLL
jgi:hypothetical protein